MSIVDIILNSAKDLMYSLDEVDIDNSKKEEMMAKCEEVSKAIKAVSADLSHGDDLTNSIANLKNALSSIPTLCGSSIGEDRAVSIVNGLNSSFDGAVLVDELNRQDSEKAKSFFILKIDKAAGYFASSADVINEK